MSKLKQYWDGLDAVPSLDESEIEESLDRLVLMTTIRRVHQDNIELILLGIVQKIFRQ